MLLLLASAARKEPNPLRLESAWAQPAWQDLLQGHGATGERLNAAESLQSNSRLPTGSLNRALTGSTQLRGGADLLSGALRGEGTLHSHHLHRRSGGPAGRDVPDQQAVCPRGQRPMSVPGRRQSQASRDHAPAHPGLVLSTPAGDRVSAAVWA